MEEWEDPERQPLSINTPIKAALLFNGNEVAEVFYLAEIFIHGSRSASNHKV